MSDCQIAGKVKVSRKITRAHTRRRGSVMVYALAGMTCFIGITALAVDWGRIQLYKAELHHAADASAMAGASVIEDGAVYARQEAIRIGRMNRANQAVVEVRNADILIGRWNTTNRTLDTSSVIPDAVQVTTYLTKERGNPIPLTFVPALSSKLTVVEAAKTTTARWIPISGINQDVSARANPFLANMKPGSQASATNPSARGYARVDYAGDQYSSNETLRKASPIAAGDSRGRMTVGQGMNFTFGSIEGTARHDPNDDYFQPDGKTGYGGGPRDIGHNNTTTTFSNNYSTTYSSLSHENGIHDMIAPINALVGVFLSDDEPDDTAVPHIPDRYDENAPWDYSRPEERNRLTYKPKLKQIFFIGDGTTDNGVKQSFIAPPGATRLYLATWDFYEWNNNDGFRTVRINGTGRVEIVK